MLTRNDRQSLGKNLFDWPSHFSHIHGFHSARSLRVHIVATQRSMALSSRLHLLIVSDVIAGSSNTAHLITRSNIRYQPKAILTHGMSCSLSRHRVCRLHGCLSNRCRLLTSTTSDMVVSKSYFDRRKEVNMAALSVFS